MRSKIEANEYKDYILGFIFYKFLSDKEVEYLKKNDWEDADLSELVEEDTDIVEQLLLATQNPKNAKMRNNSELA